MWSVPYTSKGDSCFMSVAVPWTRSTNRQAVGSVRVSCLVCECLANGLWEVVDVCQ